MSEPNSLHAKLKREYARLRKKLVEVQAIEQAFHAQNELMDAWVRIVKTETSGLVLRSLFKQILLTTTRLVSAEESNLLLLDSHGLVIDSLGMRGATILQQKPIFLGQILDRGIEGWVMLHRRIGLIADALHDDRWMPLPKHSERVRSALCVPIFQAGNLQAIVTLMHSEPAHFHYEEAHLIGAIAPQISLLIESARLLVKQHGSDLRISNSPLLPYPEDTTETSTISPSTHKQLSPVSDLPKIGIFMIYDEGKILYINYQVAKLFGYSVKELLRLESILSLVSSEDFIEFADQIDQCLLGKTKHIACEFRGLRKDGKKVEIEMYGLRTKLQKKRVIVGALREIWSTYLQL
jgi:PAS domain S-box-containing protein